MATLKELLKQQKVDETMQRLGLKMEEIFGGLDDLQDNPYRYHSWLVKENHGFLVVNAIPEKSAQDHLFWEEWYTYQGELHHHILTLWKPYKHHEVFQAPDSDDIHPPQCFSQTWYVIEDTDMRALLLRR